MGNRSSVDHGQLIIYQTLFTTNPPRQGILQVERPAGIHPTLGQKTIIRRFQNPCWFLLGMRGKRLDAQLREGIADSREHEGIFKNEIEKGSDEIDLILSRSPQNYPSLHVTRELIGARVLWMWTIPQVRTPLRGCLDGASCLLTCFHAAMSCWCSQWSSQTWTFRARLRLGPLRQTIVRVVQVRRFFFGVRMISFRWCAKLQIVSTHDRALTCLCGLVELPGALKA